MFQLKILSGKQAGGSWSARHFPVRVGRSSTADLSLSDDGIWENHFEIDLSPSKEFVLAAKSGGFLLVNGSPVQQSALRNGDLIETGSIKLQFWLDEVAQVGLRWREWLAWALVAAVCAVEIAVIYLLLD